jgi:hypothetical protein
MKGHNMINTSFKGYLSKFGNKTTKDGDVLDELVITHKSNNPTQDFLDSLSDEFHNNVNRCMDHTEWKHISYDFEGVHVLMTFDNNEEMQMPVELKTIRISHRLKEDEESFKYDLVFTKSLNPNTDSIFTQTYLKRKDVDPETEKTTLMQYDILLENVK